jgi:pimeloyl-ACP methyl ester carboxylesterase
VYGIALVALSISGCASSDYQYREPTYNEPVVRGAVLRNLQLELRLQNEILALDPEHLTEQDIKNVLSRAPAPRIINIHGGLPLVYVAMESFSKFLIGMGYPEGRIRNPADGAYSYSSYKNSADLAGIIAWYYEKEGMPPMLIGHSLGGQQAIKVLHRLAGSFENNLPVRNPLTETSENRYTIVDPLTGSARPVVGIRVGYATVVGTGGTSRLLPQQWTMFGKLRRIPDSVEHFTGVFIDMDVLGGDWLGFGDYVSAYTALGRAHVRNLVLPYDYSHISVPDTLHLAEDKDARDWINRYTPADRRLSSEAASKENILWAADVWYSIKKQWCLEVQRLIRAKRKAQDLGGSAMLGH